MPRGRKKTAPAEPQFLDKDGLPVDALGRPVPFDLTPAKPGPKPAVVCSPELTQRICGLIAQGAWPHVAAQSCGVMQQTYNIWMKHTDPEYREFQEAVLKAAGEARQAAERRVYEENPSMWLTKGPGREREGQGEGWGDKTTIEVRKQGVMDLSALSDEELDDLAKIAAKVKALALGQGEE